jgi:gas vesicle protein
MENLNDTGTGKVIGALLVGALIGAVAGILFAPGKGSDMRNKLMSGAKDLTDDIKLRMNEELGSLRAKLEELEVLAQAKVNGIANNISQKVDTLKHN